MAVVHFALAYTMAHTTSHWWYSGLRCSATNGLIEAVITSNTNLSVCLTRSAWIRHLRCLQCCGRGDDVLQRMSLRGHEQTSTISVQAIAGNRKAISKTVETMKVYKFLYNPQVMVNYSVCNKYG